VLRYRSGGDRRIHSASDPHSGAIPSARMLSANRAPASPLTARGPWMSAFLALRGSTQAWAANRRTVVRKGVRFGAERGAASCISPRKRRPAS